METTVHEFFICHDNDADVCTDQLPFAPLPEVEEKGFWRSAINFFKNPLKPFTELIKSIMSIIGSLLTIFKLFIKLITTLFKNPENFFITLV